MKRAFAVIFSLVLFNVAIASDLVPLYPRPLGTQSNSKELVGGVPYSCDSVELRKLREAHPRQAQDYVCKRGDVTKNQGGGGVHVLVIGGKTKGLEGYTSLKDYSMFEGPRTESTQNLKTPTLVQAKNSSTSEVKTSAYPPKNSVPIVSAPEPLPDLINEPIVEHVTTPPLHVIAAPVSGCTTCGHPLNSSVEKAKTSADETISKIVRDDYLYPACESFSVSLGSTGSISLASEIAHPGESFHQLSADGSSPIRPKTVVKGNPQSLCKAKLVGDCGSKADLEKSPQRLMAIKTFERSDALYDKYEVCLDDKTRNCKGLELQAERASELDTPRCRAATEAFYSLCDPGRSKTPEERRDEIDKNIDSHFAAFGSTDLSKDIDKKFDPALLKCVAERESPSYQAYRMNLTACTPNPTSTAVGVFQVTNLLIAELLRSDHCVDLNKVGVPCDPKVSYYEMILNPKTGKQVPVLKHDLMMKDAQVLQDKMSTNINYQISIALVAMGLTLSRQHDNISKAVEAWKTGPDAVPYRQAVISCYDCMNGNGSNCFGLAHKNQK